jgi:hypothetical protein
MQASHIGGAGEPVAPHDLTALLRLSVVTEAGLLEHAVRGVWLSVCPTTALTRSSANASATIACVAAVASPAEVSVIYVVVEDADAAYERAKAAGADVTEPVELDYGSRDVTVTDPDGNRWTLGTYRGAAAAD